MDHGINLLWEKIEGIKEKGFIEVKTMVVWE